MPIFEPAINEQGAIELLRNGASLIIEALEDARMDGGGGIRGTWKISITTSEGHSFVIKLANQDKIKLYRTTLAIGTLFNSGGFLDATIPLKKGRVSTLASTNDHT